jgi:hypothetical protein
MLPPLRRIGWMLAVTALLVATFNGRAFAGGGNEEKLAFALVSALAASEQAVGHALTPLRNCTAKGHRQCLPAAARGVAKVAAAQRKPVQRAVDLQDRACSRNAGNTYLRGLGLLRKSTLAMARAKNSRQLQAAARTFLRADSLQTKGVKQAKACWRATLR